MDGIQEEVGEAEAQGDNRSVRRLWLRTRWVGIDLGGGISVCDCTLREGFGIFRSIYNSYIMALSGLGV